jgi:RNA polymerase sigma-70 factor (ECF subfamily)
MVKDYQRTLFSYAYNILGSSEDAKDAIQDVMTRYLAGPPKEIENEKNYLIKGVINQSINIKKKKQRIAGDPLWLPEPVATENADAGINRDEIISYSMLVLLENLNPRERATFILKEAYDYSHEDIAQALSITVENSRKLLSRAKSKLASPAKQVQETSLDTKTYLENYITVIKSGDMKSLEKLLAQEVTVITDGGGKVSIVKDLVEGWQATAGLMFYAYTNYQQQSTARLSFVNHQPAILFYSDGILTNCQVSDINPNTQKIVHIYSMVDPDKLKNIYPA